MDNEILEIIKKNIPQQTADVLKEYLEQSKKDKIALTKALNDIKESQQANYKLEEEKKALHGELDGFLKKTRELSDKEAELKEREAKLFKNELEKEVFELQCQRSAQQSIIERDLDIMNTVFRNPSFVNRTVTDETVPVSVSGGNNCSGYVSREYTNKTVTETKTIE